jgi:Xaa-Pro dipeptidase
MEPAERQARLERARELMRRHKFDAILLTGGSSLLYFTAAHWGQSERFFGTLIPAKGNCLCVCPSFEEGRAREQLERGPLANARVLTWAEDENPYRVFASGVQSIGIATGALGVDERTPFVFGDAIAKAAPQLKIASATPVTAGCRMLKSPHELELMRIANEATLQVYEAVYKALAPGMTQRQAAALIAAAYERVGFRGEASVEVGSSSSLPHGSAAAQIIREGQVVMIDDGCTVEGYNSDITRTFVYGKAGDEMQRVFDIVQRAQKATLGAARPGVECQAIDAAARKVIADAGYGPGYILHAPPRPWQRLGWPRVAVYGARQHSSAGRRNDFQRRTRCLLTRQIRQSLGRRHVHHAGWRQAVYSAQPITRTPLRLVPVDVLVSNPQPIASI